MTISGSLWNQGSRVTDTSSRQVADTTVTRSRVRYGRDGQPLTWQGKLWDKGLKLVGRRPSAPKAGDLAKDSAGNITALGRKDRSPLDTRRLAALQARPVPRHQPGPANAHHAQGAHPAHPNPRRSRSTCARR